MGTQALEETGMGAGWDRTSGVGRVWTSEGTGRAGSGVRSGTGQVKGWDDRVDCTSNVKLARQVKD